LNETIRNPERVVQVCNPSTQKAEAGGLQVQSQHRLHKTVSKRKEIIYVQVIYVDGCRYTYGWIIRS
jgi:hypothetical protein